MTSIVTNLRNGNQNRITKLTTKTNMKNFNVSLGTVLGLSALSLVISFPIFYRIEKRKQRDKQLIDDLVKQSKSSNEQSEPEEKTGPAYKIINLPESGPSYESEQEKRERVMSSYQKTLIDSIRLQKFKSPGDLYKSTLFSFQASGCIAMDDLEFCPKSVDEMEKIIRSIGLWSEYEELLEQMYSPYNRV